MQRKTILLSILCVVLMQAWFVMSCQESHGVKALTPTSPLVALTPTEYNNTIRDLLGMPSDPSAWPAQSSGQVSSADRWPWTFPAENGVEKFEGIATGQATSAYRIERYQQAAQFFSGVALQSPTFFLCKDWASLTGDSKKNCAWTSVERFAQRAWRRPLSAKEKGRLIAFWEANWKAARPADAVKLTVAGILQSPAFLYRVEHGLPANKEGKAVPLSSWELASRLSYFLWDSMPDAKLYAAAASDQLKTRAQIEKQARRMLADPKARAGVVHFHNQLLGLKDIHTANPSREKYGPLYGFPPLAKGPKAENDMVWPAKMISIRLSMRKEVELFVERTIFDGAGTLAALFTDNHGYVSTHTKPIYGSRVRETLGSKVSWTSLPLRNVFGQLQQINLTLTPAEFPKEQRAGILTLPGVLALYSHPVHPSPILRGKFILTRLACIPIPAPPASAFGKEPKDTVDAKGTNRERTEQVTKPGGCTACHSTLNPPGFALENFDSIGRWRDKDNGKNVNATTTVKLDSETYEVTGPVDLAQKLSTSKKIRDCYTLRWLRYATGVQLVDSDPGVKPLQEAFRKNDNIKELLVSIATSDLFRYRNGEEGKE